MTSKFLCLQMLHFIHARTSYWGVSMRGDECLCNLDATCTFSSFSGIRTVGSITSSFLTSKLILQLKFFISRVTLTTPMAWSMDLTIWDFRIQKGGGIFQGFESLMNLNDLYVMTMSLFMEPKEHSGQ